MTYIGKLFLNLLLKFASLLLIIYFRSQPVLPPPRVPPRPLSSVVDAVTQKMSGVIVQPTVASVSMSAKNVAHVHKNG